MSYLYIRPDENVLAGRTVTSTAGTPDTDHPVSWLTDLRPAFPARWAAGAWGASISVASQSVKLVAVANHSLDATVTVGGGVSGSILIPTLPPNRVPLNPYLLLTNTVAGVTTITFAGTNTAVAIVGEAFAGVPRTLKALKMADANEQQFTGGQMPQGDYANIPMYDQRRKWRVFGGSQVFTLSELNDLIAWLDAQMGMSQPSLLILDSTINDARVVLINELSYKWNDHKQMFDVTLSFVEYPRYRWL